MIMKRFLVVSAVALASIMTSSMAAYAANPKVGGAAMFED